MSLGMSERSEQYVQGQAYAENGEFVGVKFEGIINYYNEGGKIKANETDIEINNANSVTIMIAISNATNEYVWKRLITNPLYCNLRK